MNRKCVRGHSELFESLFSLEDDLTDMNIDVFLAWIPGHSGIQYNDMVDSIAKDTAHEIYAGILFAPNIVTFADAVKVSVDTAQKSWQFKWNNDVTGNYTRQLIPKVGVKINLPEDRNVGISYC